jgi:hypothetical protein
MAAVVKSTNPWLLPRFPIHAPGGLKQESNIITSARIGETEKINIGH